MDKRSSLLWKVVDYGFKFFYNIGHKWNIKSVFLSVSNSRLLIDLYIFKVQLLKFL